MTDLARYYDQSYPPSVWAPPVPATGATAGIPGTWSPAGSTPPASVADLQAGVPNAVTASPATAWTAGQYVQTATAGAAGRATWTGTGWVGGVAPGTAKALPGDVGDFTVADVQLWVDANPDLADEVLAAEQARPSPRSTLVDWLHGFIAHRDDDDTGGA